MRRHRPAAEPLWPAGTPDRPRSTRVVLPPGQRRLRAPLPAIPGSSTTPGPGRSRRRLCFLLFALPVRLRAKDEATLKNDASSSHALESDSDEALGEELASLIGHPGDRPSHGNPYMEARRRWYGVVDRRPRLRRHPLVGAPGCAFRVRCRFPFWCSFWRLWLPASPLL